MDAEAARDDMANVGRALMEALRDHAGSPHLKGWAPADCPSEIVGDMLNMLDERDATLAERDAENERLDAERAGLQAEVHGYKEIYGELEDKADTLRANADALAGALDAIHDLLDGEIAVRFRQSSSQSESEQAGKSRVYSLLVVPRNMARAALTATATGEAGRG